MHPKFESLSESLIDAVAGAMLKAENGRAFRRARRELEKRDRADIVRGLIRGMQRAANQKVFDRAAKLLAEYGGDEAAEALAREARSQRQYPRLAIRAFALCKHPTVAPVLLNILELGKLKQRRSAAFALARLKCALAVEPLCKAAGLGELSIGPEAVEALYAMGRTDQLARLVLGEVTYSAADCVRVLHAIGAAPVSEGFWRRRRFHAERFLFREAIDPRSPVQVQAAAAADFLQVRSTLLRGSDPVEGPDPDRLLRAASTPGSGAPDSLLRASSSLDSRLSTLDSRLTTLDSRLSSQWMAALHGMFGQLARRT